MDVYLYYKTPDMSKGKSTGPFGSIRDMEDFAEMAATEMPDNTLVYYRNGMGGTVWILRGGRSIRIWRSQGARRKGISMAQAMAAAPKMSDPDLDEMHRDVG